jgi:hypothetical protein
MCGRLGLWTAGEFMEHFALAAQISFGARYANDSPDLLEPMAERKSPAR